MLYTVKYVSFLSTVMLKMKIYEYTYIYFCVCVCVLILLKALNFVIECD